MIHPQWYTEQQNEDAVAVSIAAGLGLVPSQLQFSLSSWETNARLVFADGPLAAREQCGVNAPTCYRRLVLFTAVGAIALDRNHRVMSVP